MTEATCEYATLVAQYDGWAVGSYMYVGYTNAFDYLTMGMCLPDNTCHGFYLEYTSGFGITDNAYKFYTLAWSLAGAANQSGVLPNMANIRTSRSTYELTTADAKYGMNTKFFYTSATTWAELSEGIRFYRF